MKVQVYKKCQPASKVYEAGTYNLPAEEALFLMSLGLAEKAAKKYAKKVVEPENLKDDKDS